MGYFVQIANDAGSPVFQATQNYPDVSFASSTLFHALVTASLEHGFVPSVLRSQDAVIALAVHGPAGSRISIAIVTSEFAAGQTRDLQEELHWRLSVFYRGALMIAGGELLRRQPTETLRRLLAQRLSPIVDGVMAEESMQKNCGRVPRIGLSCSGTAVEWLARSVVADVALEKIVAGLPAKSGATVDPAGQARLNSRVAAVVSWKGRVLAATRAWQQLDAVDRALLLTLSDQVGPGTFESPARSWSLEELEQLWLPTKGAGSVHSTGSDGASEAASLRPCGVFLEQPYFSELSACQPAKRHRMVSVRLYPQADQIEANGADGMAAFCLSCCESLQRGSLKLDPAGSVPEACKAQKDPLAVLDMQPLPAESANFQIEELSLVLSLLEEEGPSKEGLTTATHLQTSADNCSDVLHAVWQHLRAGKRGESLLQCATGHLTAVALVNEVSADVVTVPSPAHTCSALPWQCRGRQRKAAAARRLLYWIHALPRLGPQRTQQYVCCESFAVGGLRREDGVHCWGIMDMDLDPEWHLGPLGTETLDDAPERGASVGDSNACQTEAAKGQRVLSAVAEFVQQLPDKSSDLWTALGGLEAEASAAVAA